MKNIAALLIVPPAERFGADTDRVERDDRLLDLDLHPTVRKRERNVAINQNFHE